jgi:hypothetical protein
MAETVMKLYWPLRLVYWKALFWLYVVHAAWLLLIYRERGKRRLFCFSVGGNTDNVEALYMAEKAHITGRFKETKNYINWSHQKALEIIHHLENDREYPS